MIKFRRNMKKFSNITGQKVSEEPKVELKQLNEEELFKSKLHELMDQILSIRTYGPVDRYERAGLIKIAGKEMLVEAILDLLTEKTNKEQVKLLESLKSEIKDWKVIDDKIENIFLNRIPKLSNRNKINSLLESYDESSLIEVIGEKISKLNNLETVLDYYKIISESSLTTTTKQQILNLYSQRIQLLR